ncbi:MAG: histidinol-phosphatase [Chitinophagaceae bacterium]
MDNYEIADQLLLLSKLMDIHGENSFKSKSYASAAFAIEKLPQQIADLPEEKIFQIKGIGESVGKKVMELIKTGELKQLKEIISNTPEGIFEMMNIKGLGPKKIHIIWKELGIDSINDLREVCRTNKISEQKGFGQKTQQSILESIQFNEQNAGKYLYAGIEPFALALQEKLCVEFPEEQLQLTGAFRRQSESIEKLEWVTTISIQNIKRFFDEDGFTIIAEGSEWIEINAQETLVLKFFLATNDNFYQQLFLTTGSEEFLFAWKNTKQTPDEPKSEEEIFAVNKMSYIPPFLREKETIIHKTIPEVVTVADIKGLIHSHSNWSDGANTIEEMTERLIELGFEYMVISDHSKAAYYANGLSEQRIKEQHNYIDALNRKFAPFKIFKSIECDILADGQMDYSNKVLSTFDLVIASVHSNLDMDEEKAMKRLLGAITNPYVTILGHMTGRLLLRRKGYPVDHKQIIDACADHNVVIEINASPSRLDMDWRHINYALEKGLTLSINPDAHTVDEFGILKYGVLVAQKGGLTKERNLSSYSLSEFETFLKDQRKKRS